MSKFIFSEQDKNKIKETIAKVEKTTSGEIVVNIVKQSDNYNQTPFVASLIVAAIFVIMVNIMSQLWILPLKFGILTYSLIFVALVVVTFLLVKVIPALKILVVSEKRESEMAHKNAVEAFVNNEIFKTKDRTGILLFISELERNVVILADSGLNQKVKPEEWNAILNALTKGIKSKTVVDSIVKAIEECGKLLVNNGFAATSENENELPDDVLL